MRNTRVNEELFSANYGRIPGALPSPEAIKPLPFPFAPPAFSSFTGSSSPLQLGVDCNSAYWQSLQKLQTNKEPSGSQLSHMPVQYPGFNGQPNRDPPGSQHSQLPVQYPGFNGQTNRDPSGSQHSHMPMQCAILNGQTNRDPSGSQHFHKSVQYPGFIGQTSRDPSGSQQSHKSVQYPGFIGQTIRDPSGSQNGIQCPEFIGQTSRDLPGSQHSHMPVQYPGFIGHSNKDPPWSQPSRMPVQYPGFIKPQQKLNLQSNMGPPSSNCAQLPQQHLGLSKDQVESLQWQQYMETPWSSSTQLRLQHPILTELPLKNKSAAKHVQDVRKKPEPIPSSNLGNNLPRALYKEKEKVTSSSADKQSCTSVLDWGLLNTSAPFLPSKESYYSRLPSDFREALEGCSPPSATIPDPYGETGEVMFDIPSFRNTKSTNPSGAVGNSHGLSLASNPPSRKGKEVSNMKDLPPPSRKGKEVVNIKKRRR